MPNKPYATNSKDSPYGAEKDLDRPTLWSQTSGSKNPKVSARALRRAKARIAKKAAKKAAAESSPEADWGGSIEAGGIKHHGRRKSIWRDSTPSLRAHRRAAERAAKKAAKAKE